MQGQKWRMLSFLYRLSDWLIDWLIDWWVIKYGRRGRNGECQALFKLPRNDKRNLALTNHLKSHQKEENMTDDKVKKTDDSNFCVLHIALKVVGFHCRLPFRFPLDLIWVLNRKYEDNFIFEFKNWKVKEQFYELTGK